MAKTSTEDLTEAITPDLITYLSEGSLNTDQLARSIDYSNLEIEDFDELKRLHFVLSEDVVQYVEDLPQRLRRVKTEHRRTTKHVRGEVRGRINWPQTNERRASLGYNDRTLFVVENPEVEIDIPENRVVKALLGKINEPLSGEIETVEQDWRDSWDDADIIELQQSLAQNVYLNALPTADEISVSDRDLTTARRARQPLYYEAAELYRLYDDLLNDRYERESVQDLLRETTITPTKDYTLFELFCVFALVRRLRAENEELALRRIQPGTDAIAILESESRRVEVYYDEGGPLTFYEDYPSAEALDDEAIPEIVHRQAEALEAHERVIEKFLSRGSSHSFFSGRPDFLVLESQFEDGKERLTDVTIGEIKYTNSPSTFSTGLRELLEYIHFAKSNAGFLFEEEPDSASVHGVLCTDGVNVTTDQVGEIEHWQTDGLQQFFDKELIS